MTGVDVCIPCTRYSLIVPFQRELRTAHTATTVNSTDDQIINAAARSSSIKSFHFPTSKVKSLTSLTHIFAHSFDDKHNLFEAIIVTNCQISFHPLGI